MAGELGIASTDTVGLSGTSEDGTWSTIQSVTIPYLSQAEGYAQANGEDIATILTIITNIIKDLENLNVATSGAGVSTTWPQYSASIANASTFMTALLAKVTDVISGLGGADSAVTTAGTAYTNNFYNTIFNYATGTGTGLDSAVEDAIFQRARLRNDVINSRTSKRIISDVAKRLPYAGMLADLLMDADLESVLSLNDVNRDILVKQGELAYQNQMDRIRIASEYSRVLLADHRQYVETLTKVYLSKDELTMKKFVDERSYKASVGNMLSSAYSHAIDFEKTQLAAHDSAEERELKARIADADLDYKDHFAVIENTIRLASEVASAAAQFAFKVAAGPDQVTFENYTALAKIAADTQLQLAALVGNLT